MNEQFPQIVKNALLVLLAVLIVVFICNIALQDRVIKNNAKITEVSTPAPNPTATEAGASKLKDEGLSEIIATEVEGVVTEISKADSFLRIYDRQQRVNYTVLVSSTSNFTRKEDAISFADIIMGDTIRAVAKDSQNAFEFHADAITVTESAEDAEMDQLLDAGGVELTQSTNN